MKLYSWCKIIHYKKGHIEHRKVVKEPKFYWKGMGNDWLKYLKEYLIYISNKLGVPLKPKKKFIPKGTQEKYVCYSWKLNKELQEIWCYEWVMDIINYFNKYISFKKNNLKIY